MKANINFRDTVKHRNMYVRIHAYMEDHTQNNDLVYYIHVSGWLVL